MAGYQRVIICGRLGQDPEVRKTVGGDSVCSMSVATSETWKDKDGKQQERTEWHRCTIWGAKGDAAAKYLKKGQEVLIEGKLQTQTWEDNGVKRQATKINVDKWTFVGGKKEASESTSNTSRETVDEFGQDDDVPF